MSVLPNRKHGLQEQLLSACLDLLEYGGFLQAPGNNECFLPAPGNRVWLVCEHRVLAAEKQQP